MSDNRCVQTKHDRILRHSDGRAVQYTILGSPDLQRVLFYSHGFPASRIEAVLADRAAREEGITVIALDRPGFGSSEWYPGRRFEDWASDLVLIADQLGVQRFSILGVSGGTPSAVAAAASLPERVASLIIVSGIAPVDELTLGGMNPVNRTLLHLGRKLPWVGRGCVWGIAQLWRVFPGIIPAWLAVVLPAVDRAVIRRREVGIILGRAIKEAFCQGVRGVVTEFMLLTSDWRGLLARVRVPTTVWHGDADSYVPIGMGEALHQGIQGSAFRKVKGGGHFMILDTISEVLKSVA